MTGQQVVNDVNVRVQPLVNFPDSNIAISSKELIDKHSAAFPMERILKQRQTLKLIPVTVVHYDYETITNGTFRVYGLERKVHFPDYPTKCCCCCIL